MARSATTLKNELVAVGFPADDATTSSAWATAFHNYFLGAASGLGGVVPYVPQASAQMAMQGALAGMSATGASAAKIQAGVQSYWTTLAGVITAAFPGAIPATCIPPAGLGGLSATLGPIFATNTSTSAAQSAALTAVANAIHAANAGGTAAFPPPVGGTPQPIL